MGVRREARERAIQFLFQCDLNPPENLEDALEKFWISQSSAAIALEGDKATWGVRVELPPPTPHETSLRLFADPLIKGVLENLEEVDKTICKYIQNWEIKRLAVVDRNVLRLAVHEMLHREDIPPIVSINEAIDIAKRFSTDESGKFVNGILDRFKDDLMRPSRIAS